MADRVREQVGDRALNQQAIGIDSCAAPDVNCHSLLIGNQVQVVGDASGLVTQVDRLALQRAVIVVRPGDEKHICDQPGDAFQLSNVAFENVLQLPGSARLGQGNLRATQQRGHGRSHLVSQIAREFLKVLVPLGNSRQYAVEFTREISQLSRKPCGRNSQEFLAFRGNPVTADGGRFAGGEVGYVPPQHTYAFQNGRLVHTDQIARYSVKPSLTMSAEEEKLYQALYSK